MERTDVHCCRIKFHDQLFLDKLFHQTQSQKHEKDRLQNKPSITLFGHETYDRFGTIQRFESGSVYACANSIFEPEVLAATLNLSLWWRRPWLLLPHFDGRCPFCQLVVMEQTQSSCSAWLGGLFSVVCFLDSTGNMTTAWPNSRIVCKFSGFISSVFSRPLRGIHCHFRLCSSRFETRIGS